MATPTAFVKSRDPLRLVLDPDDMAVLEHKQGDLITPSTEPREGVEH
jgi:hypothetical protein